MSRCCSHSLIICSESGSILRTAFGELRPFWNSDRIRHQSSPFLQANQQHNYLQLPKNQIKSPTSAKVLQMDRPADDLVDIFAALDDWCVADMLQIRSHLEHEQYHWDRTAKRHELQATLSRAQCDHIRCTWIDRICPNVPSCRFLNY